MLSVGLLDSESVEDLADGVCILEVETLSSSGTSMSFSAKASNGSSSIMASACYSTSYSVLFSCASVSTCYASDIRVPYVCLHASHDASRGIIVKPHMLRPRSMASIPGSTGGAQLLLGQ